MVDACSVPWSAVGGLDDVKLRIQQVDVFDCFSVYHVRVFCVFEEGEGVFVGFFVLSPTLRYTQWNHNEIE